ncbi:MAG: hypothetical protein SCALA702_29670 [Melioribacteraceae bacterium]|nr:MAG: hypothetical protein SCALA702_29670 [Melioribacteraceae bacterium]
MVKEIIINSSSSQTRVAITEDGKLVDFFIEHPEKRRMVGDIYLGRVARVLPGIRAAFVDINFKHDAFLHFSDIGDSLEDIQGIFDDDDDENGDGNNQRANEKKEPADEQYKKLHKGQELLIQILKEPVKGKGVRVSASLSLPGRFTVLLPFDNKIGVSKKISDFKERRRLRKIARGIIPENCGLIIRTAAKDQDEKLLSADLKYLVKTWNDIQALAKKNDPPALVYEDVNTTRSVIRDFFTPDVSHIFCDSRKIYKEIKEYIQEIQPELVDKVEHYRGAQSVFEAFKIEEQIKTLMGRKVPMPSGGHIVIEHTEAMTVIDVNSGKYAAKKEQELNSLKTDLEASREIVRQLRLRDIGGLIVVDFIDLEDDKNRKKIYDELKKEFKKDRAKVALLPMTDFGLMQITRQRVRENIIQTMHEVCPSCMGTGLLTKKSSMIHEIEEWIKRYKHHGKANSLKLVVHPSLGYKLAEGTISNLMKLQFKNFIRIKLVSDEKCDQQKFFFYNAKTGKEVTDELD